MALFNAPFAPAPVFNIRAVEAGDADEMVSRLTNQIAAAVAAGEVRMADFKIAGAGSGLLWQGWFVTGTSVDTPNAPLASLQAVAAVAGSPAEALFYVKQRLAAEIGVAASVVHKTVVAGAGDGPTYMAVALFRLTT